MIDETYPEVQLPAVKLLVVPGYCRVKSTAYSVTLTDSQADLSPALTGSTGPLKFSKTA